jgi:hypothetical protein
VQRAQVDFLKNPGTNGFIIDLIKQYNTDWTYSKGLARYAIDKMRQDFVNNGSDSTIGELRDGQGAAHHRHRHADPGGAAAAAQAGAEGRGPLHQRVHRPQHRSHLMSVPPKIAPSVRAERIPLEQVPVVDFEPFRTGGEAERRRAVLDLAGAFRNVGFAYLAGHGVDQAGGPAEPPNMPRPRTGEEYGLGWRSPDAVPRR